MSVQVDSLDIKIQSSSKGASKSVNSLINTLERLKSTLSGGIGVEKTAGQLKSLSQHINAISNSGIGKISGMVTALQGLKSITISSTVSKQLSGIATSMRELNGIDTSGIGKTVSALAALNGIPKGNLKSVVKDIKDLPKTLAGFNDVDFSDFRRKVDELNAILTPLSKTMGTITGQAKAVKSSLSDISHGMNSVTVSGSKFAQTTKSILSVALVRQAAKAIAGLVGKSMMYVENLNLFTASLGKYADEAKRYAETVSEVMGLDPSSFLRNQGVFFTLADGFGVAGDRALIMSRNLTQLGYDLSSFFNITSDDAMQKLQSGISGELEPLRRLGYDLSQAKLQAIAFGLGIDKAYASMTQAEKAQLRYYAIMTQVTTAQGDMARTLNAPANQLRVFKEQASQAGRALGNIFIPMLNAILPVAIAAAKAIRVIASAIASLFGYSLPEISYDISSGIGGIGSSAEDAASGMDNASGSARKLKSILMGFDEINQIPDMSGGGGGGGGAGGGGVLDGFDFELPEYNFLADMISSNVDAAYAKIKPFADWIVENLDTIGAFAIAIGAQLLNWQLAKKFIPDLKTGMGLIQGISNFAATAASLLITVGVSYLLSNNFANTHDYGTLIAEGLSSILGAGLTGGIVTNATGSAAAGLFTAAATLAISAYVNINAMKGDIEANGFSWATAAQGLVASIKGAISGAAIAKALGVSIVAGTGIGFAIAAGVTVAASLKSIEQHTLAQNADWGDIEYTRDEVIAHAKQLLTVDVNATVNVVEAAINNRTEAANKVNTSVLSLRSAVFPLRLGVALDNNALTSIQSAANQLVNDFNALESATKASIQLGVSLVPPQDGSGNDLSATVLTMSANASSSIQSTMTQLGNDLAYWINEGMVDGLSETEEKMINELSTTMMRISNALAQGKAAGEFQAGVQVLLSDLTPESLDAVLAEYKALYNEYASSLEQSTIESVASLRGQAAAWREAGFEEAASALEKEAASIDIVGSVETTLATQTEPARKEVIAEMQKIFSGIEGELDIPLLADAVKYYASTGMSSEAIAEELKLTLNKAFAKTFGDENFDRLLNAGEIFGFTGWDVLAADTQLQLYNALAGVMGDEQTLALLQEFGYDLSGIAESLGIVLEVAEDTGKEIDAIVSETDTFSTEVGNAATEVADLSKKTDTLEASAGDLSDTITDAKTDLNNLGESATTASGYLASASSGAGELAEKIVEIPSEKTIALSISNFTAINANIAYIAQKLSGITDKEVSIKVKAGLTNSTKAFLRILGALAGGSMQTSLTSLISLSAFARGGFPTTGQLFIANESGPELVGKIGNKTAVANEEQIGDTIFRYMEAHDRDNDGGIDNEALAAAIAAALKRAGIGTVYLDGRKLAESINRETQRQGKPAITF